MSGGGRTGRIFVRLAVLSAAAAACAALVQPFLVARIAPSIGALLAQVPAPAMSEAGSAAASDSAAAPASASASASASAPTPAPASSSTLPRIVTARPLASAHATPTVPHVTRAEIDDAIAHKLDGASAKLVRDGEGAPIGLAIQRPGRLARLGVASGDVLYAANGVRIRTADEGLAALAQLEKETKVVVTFRRGEGSYAIVVDIAP